LVALHLRIRIQSARPSPGMGRGVGEQIRHAGRSAPPALLSLRSGDGHVQPHGDEFRSRRRRGHCSQPGRIHRHHVAQGAAATQMMLTDFPLFPEQASTVAKQTDALFIMLTIVCGAVSVLIFTMIFVLAIMYRRRPDHELAQVEEAPTLLEATWIVVPFIFFMATFVWGSWLYFRLARVPDNALDIYAT